MTSLAAQLDTMMAEHKKKTDQEVEALNRLQSSLHHADAHLMRQLEGMLNSHDRRRGDMIGMLMELKARIDGSCQPQVAHEEQAFALPGMFQEEHRARQIARGVSDQLSEAFGGMN